MDSILAVIVGFVAKLWTVPSNATSLLSKRNDSRLISTSFFTNWTRKYKSWIGPSTPLAFIRPLFNASHPVVFQAFQSGPLPFMSSDNSIFPASNPPFAIHSGTRDSDSALVESAASMEKCSPS